MSHPRPHHIQQPRPVNPSSQTASRSALSSRTNVHSHHGQQLPSRPRVLLSPATSQNPDEEGDLNNNRNDEIDQDNDENGPEIEESGKIKKRGPEMLRDALEDVSNKRQRRRGCVKYVLLDTWMSAYYH
jgi:hypothetical protein